VPQVRIGRTEPTMVATPKIVEAGAKEAIAR
jgi:hypothetical protein